MGDQAALGLVHQVGDVLVGALGAANQPAVARRTRRLRSRRILEPSLIFLKMSGAGLVDQGDTVGHQHLGPQVGIAARDRRRCVDDGGDVGVDERVGGDPVQVQHVEDHDVAGADPPQQSVDVAVHPGGADDTRPRGIAGQQ